MRRILIGVTSVLVAGILIPLGFLLEAHLEMARITPELPPLAAIRSLPEGPARLRYANSGTQRQSTGRSGTYGGFLLEWPDGRVFAIDVGMTHAGMQAFGDVLESIGAAPVETLGSMGEQLGPEAERIAGVAFTHLHTDHTEGMAELCAANGGTLPVFQTPDQARRGNYATEPGREQIVASGCAALHELTGGPLIAIPGFEGLAAFAAGGHTPGSTGFVANVAGTLWIFAGDITNAMGDLLGNKPKEWYYSLLIIPESRDRLAELRPWLAELHATPGIEVVVSHDLDAIRAAGIELVSALPAE